MFWKRRKEKTPQCVHDWHLADYRTEYFNGGCDIDIEHFYVLGCVKCGASKSVEEYDYNRMVRIGLIKEARN